uniref:ARAD1C21252p n=1 Tax=Blastobotrys adeninivorans TaxID=409370 RepID=A0A060T6M0_BLAAD
MSNILDFFDDKRFSDAFNSNGSVDGSQSVVDPSSLLSYEDLHDKRKADTPDPRPPAWLNPKSIKSSPDSGPNSVVAGSDAGSSVSSNIGSGAKNSKGAKKPGRKPDPNEPASKRKAQNRAAQRAFRERKEKHLRDLEDRIKELENEATVANTENEFLKNQVQRLQDELKKYRNKSSPASGSMSSESSGESGLQHRPFTFEFPFFADNSNNAPSTNTNSTPRSNNNNNKNNNSSSSSNNSGRLSQSAGASPFSALAKSNEASPLSLTSSSNSPFTPKLDTPNTSASSKGGCDDGEETFCDQLSLACGTKDHPIPKDEKVRAGSVMIAGDDSASNIGSTPYNNVDSGISGPSFDMDFLGSYRDPIFEQAEFNLPELATTEYSLFDPIENPNAIGSYMEPITEPKDTNANKNTDVATKNDNEDADTVPAPSSKMMTCSAVWDRISAHPKFNDLDIDGLCSELRTKAKCSETGVLVTERDVDNVLSTLS